MLSELSRFLRIPEELVLETLFSGLSGLSGLSKSLQRVEWKASKALEFLPRE
jgi:hypothetical protein